MIDYISQWIGDVGPLVLLKYYLLVLIVVHLAFIAWALLAYRKRPVQPRKPWTPEQRSAYVLREAAGIRGDRAIRKVNRVDIPRGDR